MNGLWRWLRSFKPGATDIAIFLIFSGLMIFRIPMPVGATYNFSYRHPWVAMITLFTVFAWLTGTYILGAIGFVTLIVRFLAKTVNQVRARQKT